MRERANLEVVDAATGVVEVGHSPYLANSIGTILGAVQALAIETAAEAMRPDLVATDVQMHFLSQVRTGPARTHGIVVRDAADHSIIRVELVDAGADDRLGAVATVTLQRPPT
jgi:acyl-coenzyme A thioesterase PaaI-like protein